MPKLQQVRWQAPGLQDLDLVLLPGLPAGQYTVSWVAAAKTKWQPVAGIRISTLACRSSLRPAVTAMSPMVSGAAEGTKVRGSVPRRAPAGAGACREQ